MADEREATTTPNFSTLTENLHQQQAKISALKELVRQSESQHGRNTATAQEKVKNIAQRLSNLKSKASKSKLHRASSEISEADYSITHYEEEENEVAAGANIPTTSRAASRSETPGSEKITLLRKQMELNRMKMAERENKSKEIEQMVTQLKSRFETSQMSLEKSVELGRSMGDLSSPVPSMLLLHSQNRSVSDVSHNTSQPLNFENERIKFLEKRIRELEATLGERGENLSETEAVQQLERKIIDLEETIKEKESVIEARTKAVSLLTENLSKKKKNVVDSLEDTKQEMFKMQETFIETELAYRKDKDRLQRLLDEKSAEVTNLNEKNEILEKSRYELTIENSEIRSKLEEVQDYSTKLSELNKLNDNLQKRISTLETQREESLKSHEEEIERLQDSLQEKTVEANVVNANMAVLQEKYNALTQKPQLFPADSSEAGGEESQAEAAKLKQQLDESNKSMIKTKLKMKQMQKQIDTLQKSSDGSQEISRLNEEIQSLNQRIAELEEEEKEKGSYHDFQLVGNENQTELEQKLKVLETTCQNQNAAIQLLEEQKAEMTDDLQKVKEDAVRVTELEARISELESLSNEQEHRIHQISEEKEALNAQMNQYLNENMELLDKLEKISKGSSAESIEMVASLTAQEKLEIEEYHKSVERKDEEVPIEISQELNESLRSLRMESSELMEKIELFTIERREVLEKLDALTVENQVLTGNYEKVQEEKRDLEKKLASLISEKEDFEATVLNLNTEKAELSRKLAELSDHRSKLQEEINKLVKEELSAASPQGSPLKTSGEQQPDSDQSASPSKEATSAIDREACEKLLKQLDSEIQSLNKNKDKNQKLKISKKLSDNAKNVHAMMTNLLIEFYKNLDDCKQLREDLEKFKILLNNVSSDKNSEEVQHLQNEAAELREKLTAKHTECASLQMRLDDIRKSNEEEIDLELEQLKSELENAAEQSSRKDGLISTLQETIDTLTSERDHYETEVQNQMGLVKDLRAEFDQLCADVKVNNQRLNEKSTELDQLQHEFDMRLKTSTREVEILKTLVAEQKQLLIDAYQEHELDINQKIKEISDYENQVKQLTQELEALKSANAASNETFADSLKVEIKKLKDLLNESNREIETQKEALLHKQETIDTLNTQIIELYKSMEENANRVVEKEDELQYMQEIADSNREEIRKAYDKLASADKTIDELRGQLSNKVREIELLQQKTVVAPPAQDERVKQLEAEVQSLDAKMKEQHDKLKKYAANLKKKQTQCTELEEKLAARVPPPADAVDSAVVNELQARLVQYEEKINLIRAENSKLNESVQQSSAQDEIEDLRWKIDEYESMVSDKSKEIANLQNQLRQLSEKCDQVEEGTFELQSRMRALENERDEWREKSGKFENELSAARQEKEELASRPTTAESGEKSEEKKKMEKLKAAAVQLKHKLAEKKKEVEDLQAELAALKSMPPPPSNAQEIEQLQQQIKELDEMNEKILSETKVAYDNDMGLLRQKIEELDASNRLLVEEKQRKVSLEGQLETFEMTNIELREKVARLEEAVASLDAERNSLIREKLSLDRELEEKDELIGRKLRETEAENVQLNETIKELNEERNALLQKMNALEMQITAETERSSLQLSHFESDNGQLQQQIQSLQSEIKRLATVHEQALAAKHAEIDEMESQFSSQLQKLESERKSIQEALEKANDQIVDYQDEIIRLRDNAHSLEQARTDLEREMSWLKLQNENYTQDQLECEQLRMQLMQSETELENLRSQNETIISNHDAEVLILRQQIADLEAMRSQVSQNQTDDQVMLQNENVKLKELLIEKENVIQQKAMQLQMATMFEAPVQAVSDPFATLQAPPPSPPQADASEVKSLQDRLKQATDEMERLRETQMMTNMELDVQSGKIHELMSENRKLQERAHEMQSMMDNLIRTNVELEAVTERQKGDLEVKDREISEIKSEMTTLREHQNQSTDDDKLHPELHSLQNELVEKNRAIENLQVILKKYETQPVTAPVIAAAPPPPFSTSMFFDDPQPSTSSLFDDPFNLPPQPVVEEVITRKKAYVYDEQNSSQVEVQTEEHWLFEHQENVSRIMQLQGQLQAMEQRVMEQYMELEAQRQRIVELEANQRVAPEVFPQVEPECVAKKAYLCYDKGTSVETQTEADIFREYQTRIEQLEAQLSGMRQEPIVESEIPKAQMLTSTASFFDTPIGALEIEDTWGWGSDNSAAVQEFAQLQQVQPLQTSLLSPRSDLEVRLQEQRDIVEKLESEKNALNEELAGLRDNSKKMIKKLKEYQQKIKEMEASKRRSSTFDNEMDLVIQEELKSQVLKLENRLKEFSAEREKEQHEKDALSKKIEVLSNANDRMLEMKERQDSQMEMYQLKIKDLNQKLQNLEEWGGDGGEERKQVQAQAPVAHSDEMSEKIKELSDQLKDMAVDNEELQALLDEEKNNNKVLEEKLSKFSSEQSFNDASKDDEIQRLSQQLAFSHAQCEALNHQITSKNHEIQELIAKIDQLSHESVSIRGFLDELRTQVQQKTDENQSLNDRLQKLETNNDELSHERKLYNQSIEQQYQEQIQDYEARVQALHGEMEYKSAQLGMLTEKNEELTREISQIRSELNAKESEILTLKTKASETPVTPPPSPPSSVDDLAPRLAHLEKINSELAKEKSQMEHELQVLNDQVLASLEFEDRMKNTVLELDAKNMEIQMLKATIENIQSQPSQGSSEEFERLRHEKEDLEKNMQTSIDLLNAQWSQMVEQRGNEVANSWKQHLEMREAEFTEIEANLRASLAQQAPGEESEAKSADDSDTMLKMKSIMESQEVEIVSLKEQLAIRSAEFAALSARVDPYNQMSTSMSVSPIPSPDADKVPRSELDLALYMLHQRDMRLEEITMELVRLLEERDTLQLRLSNAIRQIEDIKKKFNIEAPESSDQSTPEKHPAKAEDDEQLKAKLSELNTIRHLRDKDIADEREKRFVEHMTLFQRDIGNIPLEAAARIVSGSDQNQSPSSVLMNWILGKKPE